ncbi:MAG: DUF488 family protein [Anaerolineae bacterium]
MSELTVYSIGHSDHAIDDFVALLKQHGINALVDVRSQPYSRWVSQFNREALAEAIEAAGLRYVWLGDTLGGRPQDQSLYDGENARPDYDRMAESADFQAGIEQLLGLAGQTTVAMMCSEGDYRHCHRTLLITPALLNCDVRVVHILPDGRAVEAVKKPEQLSLFDD